MFADEAVQVVRADAEHRLHLGERIGAPFERRGDPDHVPEAGEVPRVLDDLVLRDEGRVVIAPDVTIGRTAPAG